MSHTRSIGTKHLGIGEMLHLECVFHGILLPNHVFYGILLCFSRLALRRDNEVFLVTIFLIIRISVIVFEPIISSF